jgi:ketosteroid isomerase-like protein
MAGRGDDIALIRRWFQRLADRVQAVDYVGARPLFAEDMIAFGTVAGFVTGRDATEKEQWRNVWGRIDRFRWRLDDVRAIVSADRLTAAGMAVFDSTGYGEDGTPYDRPGRATVVFGRTAIGEDWVAQHTHFSLFRGVPTRSFGNKPEKKPEFEHRTLVGGRQGA